MNIEKQICFALGLVFGFVIGRGNCQTLPLGTINNSTPITCPAGFAHGASCQSATVSCPNLLDIGVTFGTAGSPTLGTIVFMNGDGGTMPAGGFGYGTSYIKAGYQIAQIAFAVNWETGTSILETSCRPATMLAYLETPNGAQCAQGTSAGSGAVAYAMAQYGVHFDAVELIDGPVFSAIDQGCEVPNASTVIVTPTNGIPWQDSPIYNLESGMMTQWTGNRCLPKKGVTTSAEAQAWAAMSITAPGATLSFPVTSLGHWVCDNGLNPSAAQSYLWFSQVTGFSSTLTQLSGCTGAEGTGTSVTPQGVLASVAITADMISSCHKH